MYVCMCGHLTTGRFQQAYVWVPSHGEKRFAALKLLRASTNATSHGRYASTRGCGSALRGVLQMLRRRSKRSRLPNRHRCRHRRPSQAAVSQRVAVLFASRRWRSPWQLFLAVIAFASAAACMFAVLCMYVCMYLNMYADWRTLDASLKELLSNIRKNWQAVMKLEDERSRGVILKSHEVKGFLKSGMAGLYEVKREPCHIVEHMSTAKTAERHIRPAAQRTNKSALSS